jgi:ergothioneine biosynthesis protein EgtC
MCRWLAYSGSPIYLDSLLLEPENSLIHQSLHAHRGRTTTNGDGFGVGWYGERDHPGLYREILPAWNDQNLHSLTRQIRSGLFLAHVRASTGTATSRANCHPFNFGPWLFMHNGQIGGYQRIRRALDLLIPDTAYPARLGTTDSELIFLLLFRHGLERDPVAALRGATAEIVDLMHQAQIAEPFRMTAALSDGKRSWAVRFSTDHEPPSLYWHGEPDELIVVSEPLDGVPHYWRPVPPGHLLSFEHGSEIVMEPFRI